MQNKILHNYISAINNTHLRADERMIDLLGFEFQYVGLQQIAAIPRSPHQAMELCISPANISSSYDPAAINSAENRKDVC